MAIIKKKSAVKKAAFGTIVPKPKPKTKTLPPAGKQTPADFYPESYDKRFPRTRGGGANYNGPSVEPLKKDPTGMSRNGSTIKKAKSGGCMKCGGKMKK
jgi:hypothetical protein